MMSTYINIHRMFFTFFLLRYTSVLRIEIYVHLPNIAVPPWLTKITNKICQWTVLFPSATNHVLINEYQFFSLFRSE
jgi:hypothetical protein